MITPQQEIQLHRWVGLELRSEFEWGLNDCNSLVLRAADLLAAWRTSEEVVGKFWDRRSAVKFQAVYGRVLSVILKDAGARRIRREEVQPGDFIVSAWEGEPWERGHVCMGSKSLSSSPDWGVALVPTKDLLGELSFWRVF